MGTGEQVIKHHRRGTFDKPGVWSRLELATYLATHGGKNWLEEPVFALARAAASWESGSDSTTAVSCAALAGDNCCKRFALPTPSPVWKLA